MSVSRPDRKAKPPRRRLTAGRKWAFRAIAVVVVPAALLLLTELVLILVGYGTSSSFFTKISGRDAYTTNQRYGWRFFLPVLARQPAFCEFSADKQDDTYRIFVLGGSAARGMPDPSYAFGRLLKVMLEENYPQTSFEVVNAAMTAINSHVVRVIADDCARYDPDLFVVYMGNNEVVGPYGPGTVFEGFSDNLSAICWSITARSTRLGQLVHELGGRLGGGWKQWQGMQAFMRHRLAADDPRLEGTYAHLQQNLMDICKSGQRADAGVILCTVASNLKDNPPFASLHRTDLTDPEQARWKVLYDKGTASEEAGEHPKAIEAYLAAVAIDDSFAELRFRLARCHLAVGDRDKARDHFIAARDFDALRFRTDSRINRTIRQVAEGGSGEIRLADVVATMDKTDQLSGGIVGDEFFFEHVHLNFEGNYQVASTVFKTLVPILPESIRASRAAAPAVPSRKRCAKRLAFSDWVRRRHQQQMLDMMHGPPFDGQLDHGIAQQRRRQVVNQLAGRLASPDAKRQTLAAHTRALERDPDDPDLIRVLAVFLSETGDEAAASSQWRTLATGAPEWAFWKLRLGTSLARQGKSVEAAEYLEQGLSALPYDLDGQLSLARTLAQLGKMDQAISRLRYLLTLSPDHLPAQNTLGRALLQTGHPEEAAIHLRRVLKWQRSSPEAHFNMGLALLALGKLDEAADMFRRTLELDPDHAGAKKRLAATRPPSQTP